MNRNDNLVKSTDGRGNVTRYEYDKLNRIIKIVLPNGKTQTTEYDDVVISSRQSMNVALSIRKNMITMIV